MLTMVMVRDYGNDLDGGDDGGASNDDGNADNDDIELNISTKCKIGCSDDTTSVNNNSNVDSSPRDDGGVDTYDDGRDDMIVMVFIIIVLVSVNMTLIMIIVTVAIL